MRGGKKMKKIKKLLSKWWFYLILFIVTLIVPFIINELYKVGGGYITKWDAADVLSFYGSYLTFIGTVILGVVAIYQNKKAHQLNEELQKLQQAQYISMVSISNLEISKQSVKYPNYMNTHMRDIEVINLTADQCETRQCYHLDVEFENSSSYPIVQIIAHAGSRKEITGMLWGMVNFKEVATYIPAGGKKAIRFIVPSIIFEQEKKYQFSLSIDFYNVFDYGTPATIYIEDLENTSRRNEYKYRLSKFTDIRPKSE